MDAGSANSRRRLAAVGLGFAMIVALVQGVRWAATDREDVEPNNAAKVSSDRDRERREQAAFDELSQNEHLTQARTLLVADASQASIDLGFKHLAAISANSPQGEQGEVVRRAYETAKKRRDLQLARVRADEVRKQAAAEANVARILRAEMAKAMENLMLDGGINVDVRAIGKDQTVLHLKWVLVNKVLAHQMSKQADFFSSAKAVGFKRVEIVDGFGEGWHWNLE